MTPEQIAAIQPGDSVEVNRRTAWDTPTVWHASTVTHVSRTHSVLDPKNPQVAINVSVETLKENFRFSGPQLVTDVRVPNHDVATLLAQLEAARKDADAYKHLADDRLEETKAMHKRAEKAETMLDGARKALASYFGRTCQDIVPEVKYAVSQLAEARERDLTESLNKGNPRMAGELAEALGHPTDAKWFQDLDEVRKVRLERDALKVENEKLRADLASDHKRLYARTTELLDCAGVVPHDEIPVRVGKLIAERDRLRQQCQEAKNRVDGRATTMLGELRDVLGIRMSWPGCLEKVKLIQESAVELVKANAAAQQAHNLLSDAKIEHHRETGSFLPRIEWLVEERDKLRSDLQYARDELVAERKLRDKYQLERDDARRALDNMYAVRDAASGKTPAYITGWQYTKRAGYPVVARVTFSRFPEQSNSAVVPREDFSMLIVGDGRLEKLASAITYAKAPIAPTAGPIDGMIGRLDRLLSEFLLACDAPTDEADRQTLKHHADDLIGVGSAALVRLGKGTK